MMISCEEAATICNKSQYKEAGFLEKIQLRIHTLFCKTCSVFSSRNKKLTELCEQAPLRVLSGKDKQQLKQQLFKELNS